MSDFKAALIEPTELIPAPNQQPMTNTAPAQDSTQSQIPAQSATLVAVDFDLSEKIPEINIVPASDTDSVVSDESDESDESEIWEAIEPASLGGLITDPPARYSQVRSRKQHQDIDPDRLSPYGWSSVEYLYTDKETPLVGSQDGESLKPAEQGRAAKVEFAIGAAWMSLVGTLCLGSMD
ncbi:hypothetical protein ABW21_db0205647 [Orbilia brochopaga]|nr:hypothetical protein ABW21_db0205647 [Drechslerella brochopaga]